MYLSSWPTYFRTFFSAWSKYLIRNINSEQMVWNIKNPEHKIFSMWRLFNLCNFIWIDNLYSTVYLNLNWFSCCIEEIGYPCKPIPFLAHSCYVYIIKIAHALLYIPEIREFLFCLPVGRGQISYWLTRSLRGGQATVPPSSPPSFLNKPRCQLTYSGIGFPHYRSSF